MAHTVEHDFAEEEPRPRPPYPFDRWYDGRVWRAEAGTDYPDDVTSDVFIAQLEDEAARRGGDVRAEAVDDNAVVFQYHG